MLYMCIACGKTWGSDDGSGTSHGYCEACCREQMKPLVRKKQVGSFGFSCFCEFQTCPMPEIDCKYREICTSKKRSKTCRA